MKPTNQTIFKKSNSNQIQMQNSIIKLGLLIGTIGIFFGLYTMNMALEMMAGQC